MKLFKYTMALAAALALNVNAGTDANPALSGIPEILASSTSAELPAQAAKLVAQADAKSLQATTIAVVKAAVGLNPAAAALIVGSIAQSTPAMAATAAATAAALVPNQAPAIARAAASSAPAKAGTIVEAVCRVLPASYEVVADAVSDVVPSASKEILAGIAAAIPELQSTKRLLVIRLAMCLPLNHCWHRLRLHRMQPIWLPGPQNMLKVRHTVRPPLRLRRRLLP